jgi:hypothetical protein
MTENTNQCGMYGILLARFSEPVKSQLVATSSGLLAEVEGESNKTMALEVE